MARFTFEFGFDLGLPPLEKALEVIYPLQLSMVTCRKSSRTPARFPRAVRRMRRELPPPP